MSNTVKLIINIPEDMLEWFKNGEFIDEYDESALKQVLKNGTPLPKGHGDLKDAEKLKNAFIAWSMAVRGNFTDADIASIIYNSPTIIEADKAESEKV